MSVLILHPTVERYKLCGQKTTTDVPYLMKYAYRRDVAFDERLQIYLGFSMPRFRTALSDATGPPAAARPRHAHPTLRHKVLSAKERALLVSLEPHAVRATQQYSASSILVLYQVFCFTCLA